MMQSAFIPALVERKNTSFQYHPLTKDEQETVDAILAEDPNNDIILGPTHHIDENGSLHGFRVAYAAHTTGVTLPINREMFFGHTVAEAFSTQGINPTVLELAADKEKCRSLMLELLQEIDKESRGSEATLYCMPQNIDSLDSDDHATNRYMYNSEARAIDSKTWVPELPVQIGIYHSFVRGFAKDSREHKIYLSCTGGCTLASESYYNLLLDLGKDIDIDEIVESEETFWLRNAAYRARCRLLYKLAQKFGIALKHITDLKSYDGAKMALSTTDTVYNNIVRMNSGHVTVFDQCVDTTTTKNGIINTLHPTEGIWIYRGVPRTSAGMAPLGFGFGDQRKCGIFPHGTFKLAKKHLQDKMNLPFTSVATRNNDTVVTYGCDPNNTTQQYSWPDERFFSVLQDAGWDRNNGFVELMPIIVGISRW